MWGLLLNKYVLSAIAAVILIGVVYHAGYSKASAQCDVKIYRETIGDLQSQLQKAKDDAAAALVEVAALKTKNDQIHETVKTIIQKVPVVIKDNRACDFPPDFVDLLNQARGARGPP